MIQMLCMNKLEDYEKWRPVFDGNIEMAVKAGLHLKNIWRSAGEPDTVYFLFDIEDMQRAEAFVNDPLSAQTGKAAGVIEGWIKYIEPLNI